MLFSNSSVLSPIPDTFIIQPPSFPFSTTFVSPVTMFTFALIQVSLILLSIRLRSDIRSPSSKTNPQAKAKGLAPRTDISLTVPDIAKHPISPPGKNIGFTACESLLNTISPTTAASSRASRGTSIKLSFLLDSKCFKIIFLTNSCITEPPAPCNIVIRSYTTIFLLNNYYLYSSCK